LAIQVSSQDIDILVIEADRVRRAAVFQFVAENEVIAFEVHLEDGWRFLLIGFRSSDEIQVAVGDSDGFVVVWQLEI
jgi:hypothetical protein